MVECQCTISHIIFPNTGFSLSFPSSFSILRMQCLFLPGTQGINSDYSPAESIFLCLILFQITEFGFQIWKCLCSDSCKLMVWEWVYILLSNITTIGLSIHGFQQAGMGTGKESMWIFSTSSNFCLSFPHLQYMAQENKILKSIFIFTKKGLRVPAFQ